MEKERDKYTAIAIMELGKAGAQGLTAAELSDKGGIFLHNAEYALRVLLIKGVIERRAEPMPVQKNWMKEVFRYQLKNKD